MDKVELTKLVKGGFFFDVGFDRAQPTASIKACCPHLRHINGGIISINCYRAGAISLSEKRFLKRPRKYNGGSRDWGETLILWLAQVPSDLPDNLVCLNF
jgi:hypothetical protein